MLVSIFPDGWGRRLVECADLDASYEELADCQHFFAESMRGRIRSLQLRMDEARWRFQRASLLSEDEEASIENVFRVLLHHFYSREHALLEGRRTSSSHLPALPIRTGTKLEKVLNYHQAADATEMLHYGNSSEALDRFRELLESADNNNENEAAILIGIAACEFNLGRRQKSLYTLRTAEGKILQAILPLDRLALSAKLSATYRYVGAFRKAARWNRYLHMVPCPEETRAAMRRRSALMVERSRQSRQLVVL